MKATVSRRQFCQSCGLSLAAVALGTRPAPAIEPIQRPGKPRLLLSLAAYSFRDSFGDSPKARPPGVAGRKFDLFQFVDYCADHGCDGTELTSYYFPKNPDDDYLVRLRRQAFLRGVAISGTSVGNTFTHPPGAKRDAELALVRKWIDHASVLGAPHIRIFAGNVQPGSTKDEARRLSVAAIEECAQYAATKGVFLGLENHGGIVSEPDEVLEIIRAVKNPWVGINLDTGNFHNDDPYDAVAKCAPYAVNVQLKAEISRSRQKAEPVDLGRMVKILREANYQGFVALEYESKQDPWQAVPGLLKRMKEAFAA